MIIFPIRSTGWAAWCYFSASVFIVKFPFFILFLLFSFLDFWRVWPWTCIWRSWRRRCVPPMRPWSIRWRRMHPFKNQSFLLFMPGTETPTRSGTRPFWSIWCTISLAWTRISWSIAFSVFCFWVTFDSKIILLLFCSHFIQFSTNHAQ